MHAGDIISGARRESVGRDLDGLQGTWNIVSLEMDGQKMPGGGARIEGQSIISGSACWPFGWAHCSYCSTKDRRRTGDNRDRKSTRLNSRPLVISYAVF